MLIAMCYDDVTVSCNTDLMTSLLAWLWSSWHSHIHSVTAAGCSWV